MGSARQNPFASASENVKITGSNRRKPYMNWVKPEFEEITLSMEVTAYVNAGK
jgi:coenzyme PQQ precursor peptide PqqA